ncbi:hypothetical protein B0I35DRAFT_479417 [Stachybotrys elegans]|uniref:Mitochondrial pyruvate carrier n=1 Tax=Stachybotrys elegans TaxID=80388 RepID=A0A8K0SUF9_9HYPO|nr:hypothetical protein B0I35DRAFT_479417 [Stachybotrys elegans]
MAPSSNVFRAAQPLFRQGVFARQAFRPQQFTQQFRQQSKRWQSAASTAEQSWFKKMWESEVGIKTVHFWAPVMKWALVLAGVADFARPAEKLSLTQNAALTATGIIWTRWCFVIRPKNYLLAAVNFFLAIVGTVQVSRIAMYEMDKNKSIAGAVEDLKEDVKAEVKEANKAVKA